MLGAIGSLLRGLTQNPILVATARGIAEGIAFVVLYGIGDAIASGALPDGAMPFAPLLLMALRMVEGWADHIDPAKSRQRNQAAG